MIVQDSVFKFTTYELFAVFIYLVIGRELIGRFTTKYESILNGVQILSFGGDFVV